MKKILVLVVLGALVFGGYHWLHATPEKAIRNRLIELAKLASFQGDEAPLVKLANAQKLSSFCSVNVEVTVDLPGGRSSTISGRDEVLQAVAGVRQTLRGLQMEFLDITVQLGPDNTSATATLTARGHVTGDRDEYIQELRFIFQKTDNDWLISKIETIKTLTRGIGWGLKKAALSRLTNSGTGV